MKVAFTFPGQGSQVVGMGKEFHDNFTVSKQVFDEVDSTLNQKLSSVIFDGSQELLTLTENTQPALMAVSIAIVRALESELGIKTAEISGLMAGHSLGEYTANCAAGTFALADTARLLRIRGSAMQKAVPVGQGAMAAILNMPIEAVEILASDAAHGQVCVVANDNSDGQVVISGHKAAIDRALPLALERGAKRAILLPVSAPFHSPLMDPAACVMAESLDLVTCTRPQCPILTNVSASLVSDEEILKRLLIEQVTGRVRWRESMTTLPLHGITHIVEIGAGKVLTGLAKKSAPSIEASTINSIEDMNSFIKLIGKQLVA